MKIGYFEVFDGCAGDMLVASLLDAGLSLNLLKEKLSGLPFKNYKIDIIKTKRKTLFNHSIESTIFKVIPFTKEEKPISYKKIINLIDKSEFSNETKNKIKKIFKILAVGESNVHKEPIEKVHFHQIGQIDAIVEIVSVVVGLELLKIEKVYASKIGLSNPAPATIEIAKNLPVVFKGLPYEITTPTGISIIKGLCESYGYFPEMFIDKIGYGAGTREEPSPNLLKFFIGSISKEYEKIVVIETSLDDFNPVFFDNLMEKLFKKGVVDVNIFPGQGKKNRPIFNLKVLVPEIKLKDAIKIIFEETTTLGVRFRVENRILAYREFKNLKTEWGEIPVKIGFFNGENINISPEYDICKKIAKKYNIPLKKLYTEIYKKT